MTNYFKKLFLGGARSSKAIYGIILITTALIGLDLSETEPLTIAIKTFFAGFVIVLAEIYSEFLGEKIRRHRHLVQTEKREIVFDSLAICSIALVPVTIFLLCSLASFDVEYAFNICYVLSILGLGIFGYLANIAAGDNTKVSTIKSLAIALTGLIVILVKYYFSH